MVPLSNVFPSSLVIVWGADDIFFQVTVVPALIVNVAGLKIKLQSLLVMIVTVWLVPGAGVGIGVVLLVPVVGAGVEVVLFAPVVGVLAIVVAVGTELVPGVLLLPQAASSTSAPTNTTSRHNQAGALRCGRYIFFDILFSLSSRVSYYHLPCASRSMRNPRFRNDSPFLPLSLELCKARSFMNSPL